MYVLQFKKPEESRSEWDPYKIVERIPGPDTFAATDPVVCSLDR